MSDYCNKCHTEVEIAQIEDENALGRANNEFYIGRRAYCVCISKMLREVDEWNSEIRMKLAQARLNMELK